MKLSFYEKKYNPSSYRLISQVFSFSVLVFVLWILSIFIVGNLINLSLGFGFYPLVICVMYLLCTLFSILWVWRKDRPRGRKVIARIIMFSLLYILLGIVLAEFVGEDAMALSGGYGFVVFMAIFPFGKYPKIKDPDDDSYIFEYPALTRDAARFQGIFLFQMFFAALLSQSQFISDSFMDIFVILMVVGAAALWLAFWRKSAFRSHRSILIVCIAAGVSVTGALAAYMLTSEQYPDAMPDIVFLFLVMFVFISSFAFRRTNAEALQYQKDMLKRAKVEYTLYCPVCSYNMSGSTKLCCPECGTEYALGRLIEENEYLRNPDMWLN